MSYKDTKWRALVRVHRVLSDQVLVILPSRNPHGIIAMPLSAFPDAILAVLKDDYRLYAQVNLGAEDDKDLTFSDWEAR